MSDRSGTLNPLSRDGGGAADAIPQEWVSNLLRGLAQTLRARQIYSLSNPTYQRFVASLRSSFAEIWQRIPDLTLEVEEEAILWGGSPVHRGESKSESLAFLFFKDGIRELTFARGFEEKELEAFVEVLHRARNLQPTDENDLLTLLWSQNFAHLHHIAVDLFAEGLEIPEAEQEAALPAAAARALQETLAPLEEGEEGEEAVEDAQRQLREARASITAEQFDATLYFLDPREMERLREEIHLEMERDVRRAVLGALLDSLPEMRARQQEEILGVLNVLLPQFLARGELGLAAELVGDLKEIAGNHARLAEGTRLGVNVLLNELSTPFAIDELMRAVESGAFTPSADELAAFLRHLREGALAPLIRATAGITQEELRAVVGSAVERIASEHGEALLEHLRSRDSVVAAEAIRLAGRLRLAEAAGELPALAARPEPSVRLAAVEAAVSLRSSDAMRVLVDALADPDRQVRVTAARGVTTLRYQPAAETLRALVESKEIRDADLTEKLAIFEAYGTLNTPEAVALLDRILNGRSLLGRREPSELRACAAMGLGRASLPGARKALEKAVSDDDAVVRTAVARVLREQG